MTIIDQGILLYTYVGMFVTLISLINTREFKQSTRIQKVTSAAFCCALTAAISIPMVQYFNEIPPSTSLLIGAIVGAIGHGGFTELLTRFLNVVFEVLSNVFNNSSISSFKFSKYKDNRRNNEPHDEDNDEDEPPLPKRKK